VVECKRKVKESERTGVMESRVTKTKKAVSKKRE
jgi:hypothetical protein